MKKREKTGISPAIATVLLASAVIVIGFIIFLWARGVVKEEGTKFGRNVKLVCPDVEFEASYEGKDLSITNGNVPIYRMKLKIYSDGSYSTRQITETEGWGAFGLKQGERYNGEITFPTGSSKVLLIPVLIASSGSKETTYTCEDSYYEIDL